MDLAAVIDEDMDHEVIHRDGLVPRVAAGGILAGVEAEARSGDVFDVFGEDERLFFHFLFDFEDVLAIGGDAGFIMEFVGIGSVPYFH